MCCVFRVESKSAWCQVPCPNLIFPGEQTAAAGFYAERGRRAPGVVLLLQCEMHVSCADSLRQVPLVYRVLVVVHPCVLLLVFSCYCNSLFRSRTLLGVDMVVVVVVVIVASRSSRDHLAKRDLWGLTELWQTCETEAQKTSGHSHVSCRIYESRLDLLRQEADIVAGPASRNRQSSEFWSWVAAF